jgi:hypothetical protein
MRYIAHDCGDRPMVVTNSHSIEMIAQSYSWDLTMLRWKRL